MQQIKNAKIILTGDDPPQIIDPQNLKNEIIHQYENVKNYCQTFGISKPEMSMILNKKRPITYRQLVKHARNLHMTIILDISPQRL